MESTLRAFIAIELPDTVRATLRQVQNRFQAYRFKIRWVKAENIHLTLKFLGNIGIDAVEKVHQAITEETENRDPFNLQTKGVGVFPGVKRPKVLWAGLSGNIEHLASLQQAVDGRLAKIGFAREQRKFKGHLTLGRIKGRVNPRQLVDAMEQIGGFESDPFSVNRVVLFQSRLKSSGAEYTPLHAVKLQREVTANGY